MGRSTVYNQITSPEKIEKINPENISLMKDFLDYMESVGRADSTIKNYKADLLVFFCWCLEELDNKTFVKVTKREIARFQNHAMKNWGWSSNRLRTVKAALSSLGNYIEAILDEEYEGFRSIVRKVESPPKQVVREKTVWSDEELEDLMQKLVDCGDYERACFVALATYSGRRKSELCRFKMSDFDDDKLVCDGALYKSEPIRTKGRGGGKYIPCYTLAKKFKPYLDLWVKYREEHDIESEWLFPKRGDMTSQLAITTVDGWTDIFSKLSGKEFYMHSLRHAYTTSLSKSGIPDNVIQALVGWESSDMVRLYDDTPKDEQIGAYFKDGDIAVDGKSSGGLF
jgi:integrase